MNQKTRRNSHGDSIEEADRRWADRRAPSIEEIVALTKAAFARLPESFRALSDDVAIHVIDFPDDALVEEFELDSPFDILGLYHGVDLGRAGALDTASDLNRVYLYRRPILDYWAEHDETLGDLVTHVLVHEIGHHFGLSDADMAAIEASVAE